MTYDISPTVMKWLQQSLPVKSSISLIEKLKGATSTPLYKIETDLGPFVLRLYDNPDWLKSEPDLANHEAPV